MFSAPTAALLALGIAVVLVTPGPTNTLLAAAGLRQGLRRSIPLTGAELAGYLASISVWGLFLARLAHTLPWLPPVVRIASSVYIAWLALRMWRTSAPAATPQPGIGARALFVATLLNPKAILFASAIFPAAAFAGLPAYVEAMVIFAALLVPIGLLWIAFGSQLGSGRLAWLDPSRVQRGASVVLGLFSLSLAWTVFRLAL
ncbi:multidrug transporter MatE [Burkholderia sp. WAC0059]|uniref:LysE family translocator n=1 Tax=Burkholderia sp. WAC0059 TaxID=2066022 RepID=UPI000C7F5381|nr:LysE family transporter [Burkholderia sp. WAC0059]PLZ01258.1 multidrug transporter MatE [Burkholderia sp. WAC0059]